MTLQFPAPLFVSPTDLIMAVLKPLEGEIAGLKVRSLIEDDLVTPYLLARATYGGWTSDSFSNTDNRFSRRAIIDIQVFTDGLNGDTAGWVLSELAWQTLNDFCHKQTVVPRVGSIAYLRINSPPRRVADWATSTGVQQYANLAKGYYRYQGVYGIVHRPDRRNPFTVDDLLTAADLAISV